MLVFVLYGVLAIGLVTMGLLVNMFNRLPQ
jgi:hypothetical protein